MAKMKKKPVKKPARRIWEGFLLCRKAVGTEELAEALAQAGIVCECWHEMQVMEIPVAEGTSLDVERSEIAWEGEDAIYLENHDVACVFELTVPEDGLAAAGKAFAALAAGGRGVVREDTEDFQPVLAGSF